METFSCGQLVIYGIHGVCKILAVEAQTVCRKKEEYYVLEPVERTSARYYVPTKNPAAVSKLHRMLTKEELDALLSSDAVREDVWISDENRRKQRYREIVGIADRVALLAMVHTLYKQRESQIKAGRKFHLCDETFLKDAERLLSCEFSIVLGIPASEVGKYILDKLNK